MDALPDQPFQGYVAQIKLHSVAHWGDVTYPVSIEFDADAPGLLWGTTGVVEIARRQHQQS
jgi:hypothetical protein